MRQFYGQFDPKVDEVAWRYFGDGFIGHAIEVGACDGIFYSNTYAFEQAGWITLAIEPNPEWWSSLVKNRRHTQPYAVSNKTGTAILTVFDIKSGDHSALTGIATDRRLVDQYAGTVVSEIEVPTRTLDDAIKESGIFPKIDYVSIDTEGNELQVMERFDTGLWAPTLIVIENNYDDASIAEFMARRRYKLDQRVGVNDFYVPAS